MVNTTESNNVNQMETNQTEKQEKEWGYDLYPERRGAKYKPNWKNVLLGREGKEDIDKIKCERNVYKCVKNSPIVKLMMGALQSSGCPIDIRRHITCEYCDNSVSGGYDVNANQIVICHNTARSQGIIQGILAHEMIHMFDYCNNKLDFQSLDHLACTEIRAANLTHCSFLSAYSQGDSSLFRIQERHRDCVKTKAMHSILAARKSTREEAIGAIERVFIKCYADLEPIGRRIRRNSHDMQRAYYEGTMLYGYDL